MPDQLWMLEQEIEFHQGLSGCNRSHVSDNVVLQNTALWESPQETGLGRAVARVWLMIASKSASFWLIFILRKRSMPCFVLGAGSYTHTQIVMLWLNSLSAANNPEKPWILGSPAKGENNHSCFLLILAELHLSWHFGFSKPSVCTSLEIFAFISVLWGMSYISPLGHCTELKAAFRCLSFDATSNKSQCIDQIGLHRS